MVRVVLDTNILISALLTPDGLPAQVLTLVLLDPDFELCMSVNIYKEYEEVMQRPRLKRSHDEIQATLSALRGHAYWVRATQIVQACVDPDDNIFLECAQSCGAQFLVTGNTKHFPAS